ncbi:MAG TPA: nucleotidyltransferase family protein [Pyrinomonadaceae bacterium]|nr:nucleotidyltransferase family protein [Pyrinomonadaceae bacterium]
MKRVDERTENRLLLAVARRELDSRGSIDVRELVQESLDWDYVIGKAFRHGLLPLLQKNLAKVNAGTAADLVPPHVLARLKRETVANSQSVLHLIGKQLKAYRVLKDRGIRTAIFKGSVLAQMAYGEVSLRQAGDIDVLIDRTNFAEARTLLESLGYEMTPRLTDAQLASHLAFHCEIPFMRDEWFTIVDLHWGLAPRSFVFGLEAGEVMSRLQSISFAGTTIETFGVEDMVIYQSMHGAKHLWHRLEWIISLAELIRASPAIDWSVVLQRTEAANATRMVSLGLRLVEVFTDVDIPTRIFASVDPEGVMKRMAAEIKKQIFTRSHTIESTQTNLYNFKIMDRKRDALVSALRAFFVPTLSDWEALTLPASLHPLYYAFRPLRLSKSYLWYFLNRK